MLDVCRRKLAQEPDDVQARTHTLQADIRDFDLGTQFKLITMPFRPFQHLIEIQDQLACLSCVHRHLEPGGLFALDVFNPKLTALIGDVGQTERERRAPYF
jgi:hypothetical protein